MNRERMKELLPVMQAFADGKEIEYKYKTKKDDWNAIADPNWMDDYDYRVKPVLREYWIILYPSGLPYNTYETENFALKALDRLAPINAMSMVHVVEQV